MPGLRPLNLTIFHRSEWALDQGRKRCCSFPTLARVSTAAVAVIKEKPSGSQVSGLCNDRAAPVKPACWARQSAEVNTHEGERHYWPGLVHKLPREGLRHSRRFL